MKRVITCALALCLTVCLFSVPAAAVSRDGIVKWTMPLATSVDLIEMTHAEETADGPKNLLQQNVLTYEPNLTVRPMVIYGSTLYGRSTMSKIAAYLEDENLSLVAGVNGSFLICRPAFPTVLSLRTAFFARAATSTPSVSAETAVLLSEIRTCTSL